MLIRDKWGKPRRFKNGNNKRINPLKETSKERDEPEQERKKNSNQIQKKRECEAINNLCRAMVTLEVTAA